MGHDWWDCTRKWDMIGGQTRRWKIIGLNVPCSASAPPAGLHGGQAAVGTAAA